MRTKQAIVVGLLVMLAFAPAARATQFYQVGSGGFATVGAAINAAYAASPSFSGQDAVVCLPALTTQAFNEAVNISGSLVGGGDNLGAGATGAFDSSPMLVISGPSGYPQCGGSGGPAGIAIGSPNCPNNVVTVNGPARVGLIAIGLYSNCPSSAGATQSILSVKNHGYVRILGTSDPNLAVYLNGAGNPATADLLHVEDFGLVEVAQAKQLGAQGSAVAAIGLSSVGVVQIDQNSSINCNLAGVTAFFVDRVPLGGGVVFKGNNTVSGNCASGARAPLCADVIFADNSIKLSDFGVASGACPK